MVQSLMKKPQLFKYFNFTTMANKKKLSEYTIVYVFGPTRCKSAYLNDELLSRERGEFVKIGKTDYTGKLSECTIDKLRNTAIERCQQESRTGIADWCDIYDVFLFPQTNSQNVDDIIRNILCNDVYSLDNSKSERKDLKGDIKPGKEFVYGVSRNHIKHAVESYCFQLVIAADKNLEDIRTICKINAIMTSNDEEDDELNNDKDISTRKNRDISMILSPGDVVYLTDCRDKNKPVLSESGEQIEATFVGDKKFSYNDEEPKFASPLAIELIGRFKNAHYSTISGNHCWEVEIKTDDNHIKRILLANLYDSIVTANLNDNS